jgi:hypothetical protein
VDQLSKYFIPVGGLGKERAGECVAQDLSQAAPHVRVIVCYEDIHQSIRLLGHNM